MAIDNFTDEKVRIQDLAVAEPKKEGKPFDLQRNITDADWKRIDRRIGIYLNNVNESFLSPGQVENDLQFFQSLAIIAPEKVKNIANAELWKKIKEKWEFERQDQKKN